MSPRKMKVTDIPLVNDKNEEIKVLISAALTKLDANNKQMDDLEKKLKADVENEWSRACNYSSFPHQAHTVLWRYYHRKLQTYQCLHQICSDRRLDPYCLLCGDVEDNEHFLWSYLDVGSLVGSELAASYIHPLIQALLSYDKDDKVSRCSNIIPDNGTDVNRRPGNENMLWGVKR
ncbi:hypothetical protein CU097_012106 [Rhizopus azygosporus]|uniref:Uncharacterized protein n=1 Tax=Rhizopus azygosporus TaxID=86630 RepID=A0A367K2U9_RHIAZ|nr:hypothetical protein CU097_012106 [Rhizopus azygosporus]